MKIRKIKLGDLDAVSAICMAAFAKSVAGDITREGVSTFSKVASRDSFLDRMKADNLILVAERDGRIEGVVELKQGRHIAMLFVEPECQRQGIGGQLLAAALSHARVASVTVRASLNSVPVYEKYGFECGGDISELAGLVYQPMQIELGEAPRARRIPSDH